MYSRRKPCSPGITPSSPPGAWGVPDAHRCAEPLAITPGFPDVLLIYQQLPSLKIYRDSHRPFCYGKIMSGKPLFYSNQFLNKSLRSGGVTLTKGVIKNSKSIFLETCFFFKSLYVLMLTSFKLLTFCVLQIKLDILN